MKKKKVNFKKIGPSGYAVIAKPSKPDIKTIQRYIDGEPEKELVTDYAKGFRNGTAAGLIQASDILDKDVIHRNIVKRYVVLFKEKAIKLLEKK